jgi:hypothetical protein
MAEMTPGGRHAGFTRSRRATRAIATGALVVTGVFALVAAHANPGRKTTPGSSRSTPAPTVDPFGNDLSDPNLAPPASAPESAPVDAQPPPVVSGGS